MTVKIIEPMRPSHDFLGLIFGASGCFPKSTPTKYPKVSLHPTRITKVITCSKPLLGRANKTRKPAKNGR